MTIEGRYASLSHSTLNGNSRAPAQNPIPILPAQQKRAAKNVGGSGELVGFATEETPKKLITGWRGTPAHSLPDDNCRHQALRFSWGKSPGIKALSQKQFRVKYFRIILTMWGQYLL